MESKKHLVAFLDILVADNFIPKTSEDQVFILHLDRIRHNDKVENLKWATKEEQIEHAKKSPFVIASRTDRWGILADDKPLKPNIDARKKELLLIT